MNIRDRIREFRRVPASALVPNPKNWRTHSTAQKDALRGVLSEVGVVDAVLARELPDGRLMLIDGHLRTETLGSAPDSLVPVLVLDVNEKEADYVLATFDPLTNLAGQDDAHLIELLQGIDSDSAAVQKMMADLVKLPEEGGEGFEEPPEMEAKFQVLVECRDEQEQVALLERLGAEGVSCRALVS